MSEPPILAYASSQPKFVPFVSAHRLAAWAIGLIVARLISDLALLVFNVSELPLVSRYRNRTVTPAALTANNGWARLFTNVHGAIALAGFVMFFVWLYRAYRNLPALGVTSRFTPGGAIGWMFVPVMNFVRPYQVMTDLWRGSHAIKTPHTKMSIIEYWWASYLILNLGSGLFNMLIGMATLNAADRWEMRIWYSVVLLVFNWVPGLMIIAIIWGIDRAQAVSAELPINP